MSTFLSKPRPKHKFKAQCAFKFETPDTIVRKGCTKKWHMFVFLQNRGKGELSQCHTHQRVVKRDFVLLKPLKIILKPPKHVSGEA